MQVTWVPSLGWEDSLGKEMATRSSILAWIILWTQELGRLQPWGREESDTTEWLTVSYFSLYMRNASPGMFSKTETHIHPSCYCKSSGSVFTWAPAPAAFSSRPAPPPPLACTYLLNPSGAAVEKWKIQGHLPVPRECGTPQDPKLKRPHKGQ